MGIFNGNSADEKARAFAGRKGIDVSGALAVGRTYQDGADQVLAVYPGRVEVHHLGKTGSLFKKGAGVTSLDGGRIGSVSTRRDGVWGVVSIEGSGQTVEFRTDVVDRDRLAEAIRQCGSAQAAPPVAPAPPSVPAGWYPQGDVQRYWDGSTWTEHTAPLG